ncbi:cathepsin L1 [Lingula anatina]|uniref:Cathepsin L1 n=1 Tax=Lingula anatina TaxID=7574 RepID=A0A1S3I7Y9_LINAN|nr:cathepsin L1 [Lingula anatina]XP_013393977.1 cathepsin L1 [Lingula anatina]|eukprot:XP_013393976.1 cathepsin L1 [Lingula anatina]
MEKVLLALGLTAVLAVSSSSQYKIDRVTGRQRFNEWKAKHGKSYLSNVEEESRFKIYLENLGKILQLNEEYKGRTKFIDNHFADISEKEFRKTVLMPKRTAPKFPRERYLTRAVRDTLPVQFNWTTQGVVTPVKDQGAAGTCWAFSTIENLEGQWAMKGKPLTSLSVEQVVDCDGTGDPVLGHGDCGVFGGWPYLAYQYIKKAGGIESEESYPYCAGGGGAPGTCEVCPPPGYNNTLCGPPVWFCNMTVSCGHKYNPAKFVPGLKVADWKAIPENETIIAEALMSVGPLSIALNAEMLQFYHSGVFNPIFCSPENLDHAVLLVGFGTHKGWFETEDYWLVKNSWGPKWGEKGYFRILRGKGKCGVNTQVTTAVLE